jgi:hypothetical protein
LTSHLRSRLALAAALGAGALLGLHQRAAADRLHFSAQVLGSGEVDCAHAVAPRALIGAVARAGHDTFVIDSRSPLADGSALPSTFTIVAPGFPGFARYLAPGAFVHIELEVRRGDSCAQRILIRSLAAWEGQPSPSRHSFFFACNDGLREPFADAPFRVTRPTSDCGRIEAATRSDGRALEVHTLSAPAGTIPCRDQAWSYWVASPPPMP